MFGHSIFNSEMCMCMSFVHADYVQVLHVKVRDHFTLHIHSTLELLNCKEDRI